jgi:hypothetical protein
MTVSGSTGRCPWGASMGHSAPARHGPKHQLTMRRAAMETQTSPVRSMTPELNGGEGVGLAARGAAPRSGEPPGPTHEDGKSVRWFGIDGLAETEVRHGGGGLPEADTSASADERQWGGLLL